MTKQETYSTFRERIQATGAPHGVMEPEELVVTASKKWDQIRSNVSIEDRQEFEPVLEALLGRCLTGSEQINKQFTGSNR